MKKYYKCFFLALIAFVCVFGCEQEITIPEASGYKTPTITGTVSLPESSGLSLSDIWIKVIDSNGQTKNVSKASSDGSFAISGLNENEQYEVFFTSVEPEHTNYSSKDIGVKETKGYGGWLENVTAAVEEGNNIGSVKMKPLGTIKGKALISGMAEHYDVTIYIPGTSYIARTDKDGSFSIYNVPEGTYQLRYTLDDHLPVMSDSVILASTGDDKENPVTIVPTVTMVSSVGTVEGFAMLDSKQDSTGIIIKLEKDDGTGYSGSTSANGFFSIGGVKPGNYKIVASYPSYPTQTSETFIVEPGSTVVVGEKLVLFESVGTISGSVSLADSDTRAGVNILFESVDSNNSYVTVSNSDGLFQKLVKPGTYVVTASFSGYSSQVQTVTALQGSNVNVTIPTLNPADGSVTGRIILSGSNELSGTTVKLTNAQNNKLSYTTVTDVSGNYIFRNLEKSGRYYIEASKAGYLSNSEGVVDVSLGSTAKVNDIMLKSLASIVKGSAKLDGAIDHTAITVMLKAEDNSVQYDATTDQNGEYVFSSVNPGKYTMYVSKAGYQTKTVKDIVVESSIEKTLDSVSLAIGIRSITGTVKLELLNDHAGALITATNTEDPSLVYSAISNSNGSYTLAGMKSGKYNLVISCTNYNTVTLETVDVTEGHTKNVGLSEVPIARGTITGVATLEGRSSSEGVKVELLTGSGVYAETTTNANGEYSFYVPEGNYSGVRMSKEDFRSETLSELIALFANNDIALSNLELDATHVSIKGKVDVLTTDDESNVTVSFDDYSELGRFVTTSDGEFSFDHIPIGTYIMRFERTNASAITVNLDAIPSDVVNVGTITVTPNTASIKGKVNLESGTNLSNVKVEVDIGSKVLTTLTDSSGRYELGGVSTADIYTVKYSKAGWVSASQSLDSKLNALEVRELPEITLVDTTAPTINGVKINEGANTTGNPLVALTINAFDAGSGVSAMKISWTGDFTAIEWQNYQPVIEMEIPNPTNGFKTVYVKVRDGGKNESDVMTARIELTDQIRTIGGTLTSPEDLHWKVENNPYVVADDIIIPAGKELVIDPGVDILFNGNYSIIIRGTLTAIGTEEKPICFRSSADDMPAGIEGYYGDWGGITAGTNTLKVKQNNYDFTLEEGSILSNCDIKDLSAGLSGRLFVENCNIVSDSFAIGNVFNWTWNFFTGCLLNSEVKGFVHIQGSWGGHDERQFIIGNKFKCPPMNIEEGYQIQTDAIFKIENFNFVINNYFDGYSYMHMGVPDLSSLKFNTFDTCSIDYLYLYNDYEAEYNEFINMQSQIIAESDSFRSMNFSNIYDNTISPEIQVKTAWNNASSHDWRYNYWGDAHTAELDSLVAANKYDASFIYDCYDDYNVSELDWSGYVSEPWSFAGYQGDALVDVEAEFIGRDNRAKVGEPVSFTLSMLTDGKIDKYRAALTLEEIIEKEWSEYSSSGYLSYDDIDMDLVDSNGMLNILIQCMDEDGNETPFTTLSVGYACPKIVKTELTPNQEFTSDVKLDLNINWQEAPFYNGVYGSIGYAYINDEYIDTLDTEKFKNGDYILSHIIEDSAGNKTKLDIPFVINRPLPALEKTSLGDNVVLEEGDELEFDITIINATHLKTYNIYANGNLMLTRSFADDGDNVIEDSCTIKSVYLPIGKNKLSIELIDYSGNVSTFECGEFEVDGTVKAPEISGLTIEDGDIFSGNEAIPLDLTFSDAGGVRKISVMFDDNKVYSANYTSYSSKLNSLTPSINLKVPFYKNGEYVLSIEATDFSGSTTRLERDIIIDRELPEITYNISEEDGTYRFDYSITNAEYLKYSEILLEDVQLFSDNWFRTGDGASADAYHEVESEFIPVGEHELKIVAVDQAGNRVSVECGEITIDGQIDNDEYGIGKTWNSDGTLKVDYATRYLWNFEDSNNYLKEAVNRRVYNSSAELSETGLGNGSADNWYVDFGESIPFYDSSWTVEFWIKNKSNNSSSQTYSYMRGIYDSFCIRKYGENSDSDSHINIKYVSSMSNSVSEETFWTKNVSRSFQEEWHHYAVVSTGNEFEVYVDGILHLRETGKISPTEATGFYFDCQGNDDIFIDEFRISDRARSQQEIFDYVQYAKDLIK